LSPVADLINQAHVHRATLDPSQSINKLTFQPQLLYNGCGIEEELMMSSFPPERVITRRTERRLGIGRAKHRGRLADKRSLHLENLEQRLALTWAGVPPAAITIPASPAAITLNAQNDAISLATISADEVDMLTFVAPVSGNYTISASSTSFLLDTVLGVFNASGQRIAYNDDVNLFNNNSQLTINLAAGTRYYVGITNYAAGQRGVYAWAIDGPAAAVPDDAYENNDSASTAYNLGTLSGPATLGSLVMADAQDWYQFTTTATGTSTSSVSINFQHGLGDLDLELYNSAGTLLGRSEGVTNSETISLNGLAAGTYFVRAYGYRGVFNPAYSLTVNAPAPVITQPPTNPTNPTTPGTAFSDVAYYGGANDWNLNSINAPEAWAHGYTGQGVVVAVVDTGVDRSHPDLVNQLWVNAGEIAGNGLDDDHNGFVDDTSGWDFASGDNNPNDENGHGTHVAGTIAADANGFGATGVAPDATIMPVRVLGADGSGTANAVANGIRYAAQMGADIINLSLGGSLSTVIQSAIQYAQQLGVLVVAAAGNDGAATPGYPARFSSSLNNVISVGAYSSSNAIASFSNDVGNSGAVQVDAPGVNVYSTYFGSRYGTLSGTSMATPHVAGLAALILSANHNLSAAQVRSLIVAGANHAEAGSDSRGGINAALSVALAASGQVSSTATTTPQSLTSSAVFSIARLASLATSVDRSLASLHDLILPASADRASGATQAPLQLAQSSEAIHEVHDRALAAMYADDDSDHGTTSTDDVSPMDLPDDALVCV
jgi:subtilisin family serine protease